MLCTSVLESFCTNLTDSISSENTDSIMFSVLNEVTVVAEHPEITLRADKVSYDPSAMISGGQGNLYEAIQSLPGITIDSGGEIRLNGVQNLTVYIDGRKSILTGISLLNYLKAISTTDIEKIDIEYFAGAMTEGSDAMTCLNLVRRRKKDDSYAFGVNMDGQVEKARQIYADAFGEYSRSGHSISMNLSNYAARNPSELLTDRPYLDYEERITQVYDRMRRDYSSHMTMSYEYRHPSVSTAGISLNFNYFKRREPAVMCTTVPLVSQPSVTSNEALFINNNLFGEVYFKRRSYDNSSGWTAACDFFRYRSEERQSMEDNNGLSIDGDMPGVTYGAVGTFEYDKSVSTSWSISAGARISYVGMNSEGKYNGSSSPEAGLDAEVSDNLDSSFGYDENVNAVYAEGRCDYGILKASVGVRGEVSNLYTCFSGNESSESRDIKRDFFHVYPSFSVMLSTSRIGSWMLAYANKVTRPRFADLDPFIHIFDDITHVGGNINLKEANRHSFGIVWSDNSHFSVKVTGEFISDDIVRYYRSLNDRIVYVTPENIPSHLQLLLSVAGANLKPTRWWTVSATGSILYSNYRFSKDTGLSRNSLWTPMIDLKNVFRFPYEIKAEVRASFRGKMVYGQAQISGVWNTYVGLRKDFGHGKLSLSLYVKDLFNSNHFKSTILLSGREAVLYEKEYEDMRKIGVSISWRMSGGKGNSKKENRNVWIDELNRVNM